MVGDKLHPAAVAVDAEVCILLAEVCEKRRAFRDRCAVARCIDDEVAHRGLSAGAAHRAVERDVSGGVLIRNADNHVIGAVGISGDTSDNDEVCAIAGIEAAQAG